MNHLDITVVCGFLILAAWDGLRRYLADRSAARTSDLHRIFEMERALVAAREAEANGLTEQVKELVPYLKERQRVTETALNQFITQCAELIKKLEAAKVDAEKKVVRAGFQK